MSSPLVYRSGTLPSSRLEQLLGGKAANLIRLEQINQPIPPFYVITSKAFRQAVCSNGLAQRIDRRLEVEAGDGAGGLSTAAAEIRSWIQQLDPRDQLEEALRNAHETALLANDFLAVRSSVVGEDAAEQSFAGMHDSILCLSGFDRILDAVKQVWASAYNERALVYRRNQGLSLNGIAVAVIVQRMIDAQRSGVMFTCNPTTGSSHQIVISSLLGAGEGLVSAGFAADTYTVDKKTLEITSQLVEKPEKLILDEVGSGGLKRISVVEHERNRTSLTDEEVREVAEAGLAIERYFGRPQDVEFCFDSDGKLFILQSRPVTRVEEYGPAAGNHIVWDNSNIIESYSGVTSPMTFSFIQRVYTIVYHCFAEVMGISPKVVQANRKTFENMLGLFHGRVYYNLKNWYRSLRMFPGFQYNSRFMESMMGLKEPLELEDEPPPPGLMRRWFVELPALVRLLVRSTWNFWRIRKTVERFEANFHSHYDNWARLDFRRKPPHELKALYYEMEDALLWNWKAPIINDFFVMIFYGTLKKLCGSWCGDDSGSLQNDLICGEGGVESAVPAKMLLQLTKLAQDDPDLRELILNQPVEALPEHVVANERFAEFNELMQRYLDLYGFRCMNELKLEESSLRERPHMIYQVIRNYLLLDDPTVLDVKAIESREQGIRRDAEQRAIAALSKSRSLLPRNAIFRWVLKNARMGVKNRENMRFARTRIYGLLRELLCAIGEHFAQEEILDEAEDIFYLTIDEVWDFVKGTAVTTDLRGLARLRREEFDRYRKETAAPDERFDTYGMAYHRNLFRNHNAEAAHTTDGMLQGIGCCPGVVTGSVKVLHNPADDVSLSGEILVAERTDPGWVPLYPAVSGILIERGSILSHSAVVAREMGIPTIVGITGLVNTLSTGQKVKMDGRAGTVEILSDRITTPPNRKA
ncbi:MAG: phosphoenolpyruvate synthase [Planctomycetes bacterium]|nr:phosphoenolpyruvate synthase [Planctomycetota bacterium]